MTWQINQILSKALVESCNLAQFINDENSFLGVLIPLLINHRQK
jgi:hypothetical protein